MEIQFDPPTAPLDLGPPLGATADDGDVAPDLGDPGERRRFGARARHDGDQRGEPVRRLVLPRFGRAIDEPRRGLLTERGWRVT